MPVLVDLPGPSQVELAEYPSPRLPEGHVRVRTWYSGISAGTELSVYRGTNPYLTRAWDPTVRLFRQPGEGVVGARPAAGWGYSEVGEVVEVAPGAPRTAGLTVGDVVWGGWGHRSEAVLPAERLAGCTVPDGVDPLAATFARIGAIALNAVLSAGVQLGELVAVFGQGVIGLLVTRLATLSGARVIAVDTLASRRDMALAYGASAALEPAGVAERVRELTGGAGADTAIEISGVYPALHEAIRTVGVAGRVVAAGFYQGDAVGLRLGDEFHHNRVELVCSQIGGVAVPLAPRWDAERLHRVFLDQVASGAVDVSRLVTHVVPVTQAAEAYRLLDRNQGDVLQMVFEFPKE